MTTGKLTSIDRGYKTLTIDETKYKYEGTAAEKFVGSLKIPSFVEYTIKKGTNYVTYITAIPEEEYKKKLQENRTKGRANLANPPPVETAQSAKTEKPQFKTGGDILRGSESTELWMCQTEGCDKPVTFNDRRVSENFLGTGVILCRDCFTKFRERQLLGESPEIPKPKFAVRYPKSMIPESSDADQPLDQNSPENIGTSVSPSPAPEENTKSVDEVRPMQQETTSQVKADSVKPTTPQTVKSTVETKSTTTKPTTKQAGVSEKISSESLIAMCRDNNTYWQAKMIRDIKVGKCIGLQASLNTATEIVKQSPDCIGLGAADRAEKIMEIAAQLQMFVSSGGVIE